MCEFDRRYPGVMPLDRADIGPFARSCEEIARRTGTRPFYNRFHRSVLFVYGEEPHGGPLSLHVNDGRELPSHKIDDAVAYIQLGKVSRATKERWAQEADREEKYQAEQERQARVEDRRPDALSLARHLDAKRRGVSKVTVTTS